MYKRINIEISGSCNAKCPYCVTGKDNIYGKEVKKQVDMTLEDFIKIYNHLYATKMINKDTVISLFNWKEPFLNKDLESIMIFLSQSNQEFSLSTNASVYKPFCAEAIKTLKLVIFSMPGFSQKSYDKIHGFSFEKIKSNIQKTVTHLKQVTNDRDRVPIKLNLAYHVYAFNEGEIKEAEKFAEELEMSFSPSYAYLNGISLALDYLENKLPYEEMKKVGTELNFGYVEDLITNMPDNYNCPELSRLAIDSEGMVVMCCGTDIKCENHFIGKIYDFDTMEMLVEKRKQVYGERMCKKCIHSGLAYWSHNPKLYETYESKNSKYKQYYEILAELFALLNQKIEIKSILQTKGINTIAIYGFGEIGNRFYEWLRLQGIEVSYIIDKRAAKLLTGEVKIIDLEEANEDKVDLIIKTVQTSNTETENIRLTFGGSVISIEEFIKESNTYVNI